MHSNGIETAFSAQCFIHMSLLSTICKNRFIEQKSQTHSPVLKFKPQLMSTRAPAASGRVYCLSCSLSIPSALQFSSLTTHLTPFLKILFSLLWRVKSQPDRERVFPHRETSCLSGLVSISYPLGLSFSSLFWFNTLKLDGVVWNREPKSMWS